MYVAQTFIYFSKPRGFSVRFLHMTICTFVGYIYNFWVPSFFALSLLELSCMHHPFFETGVHISVSCYMYNRLQYFSFMQI